MKTRLIGDTHMPAKPDNFKTYLEIVSGAEASIQIGDYGLGFYADVDKKLHAWALKNPQHRFIRGNHDNPAVCKTFPTWIVDGRIENDVMFVGGARSVDQYRRTEGFDFWSDEELSYGELNQMISIYEITRPRVMITHECPYSIGRELVRNKDNSRTGGAFDVMFDMWNPELWIFGHYHQDKKIRRVGTEFICIDELKYIDIEL